MKEIFLYEEIGEWSRRRLAEEIGEDYSDCLLHIHCAGGEVIEGNMMFNFIRNYKGKISAVVDGIAASMAAIIMLACKERKIVDNGYIMIHAPSSFSRGNADDLAMTSKVLKQIETQAKQILLTNTTFNESEVNELMDGKDHWFSAQEALEKGLVNEIIPAVDVTATWNKKQITASADTKKIFLTYNLKQKQAPMKLTAKATQILASHQIVVGEANQENIIENLTAVIEKQQTEKEALENKFKSIEKSTTDGLIAEALAAKKISATQKSTFEKIALDSGNETLKQVLDAIVTTPSISASIAVAEIKGIQNDPKERANWSYGDWQDKDPKGLEAMLNTDKAKFNELFVKK